MAKCTKCGGENPSEAKFCSSCGLTLASTVKAEVSEQPPPKNKLGVLAGVLGIAMVALIILVVLMARGNRVMDAPPVPDVQHAPVLEAPVPPDSPQPGVLDTDVEKEPVEKPEPPAEVVAYLEHLKRVDEARMNLQQRHIASLMSMLAQAWAEPLQKMLKMTDPNVPDSELDSPPKLKEDLSKFTTEWQQLAQFFLSVQPPPQCNELAGKYYEALREVIGHIAKIQTLLVNQDLNVMNMRGQSGPIDEKLAAADRELGNVCNKYGIQKTFSIRGDMAQTPLFGF